MNRKHRRKNGTFTKGQSGNPHGRPPNSRNELTKQKEREQRAMELAFNALDVVKRTLEQIKKEAPLPDRVDTEMMIGLVGDVCDGVKEDIEAGNIGPSDIAVARNWYEDHDAEYFAHINLPPDATWEQFAGLYSKGGAFDMEKMGADLANYPPIKERIEYLMAEKAKSCKGQKRKNDAT